MTDTLDLFAKPSVDHKKSLAKTLYDQLLSLYGHHPNVPRRKPMHELISTLLSHRTTQKNEAIAYQCMIERFGTWENIRDASVSELSEAISASNYPDQKAPRIQKVLQRIFDERKEFSIDFLQKMPLEKAMNWLTSLPGVGPKTASLVLLFCFARPVLPVDTHVHRVSQRIGLIGPKIDATAAHPILLSLFPKNPQVLYNFHINALLHGQQICSFSRPRCQKCTLQKICFFYQKKANTL